MKAYLIFITSEFYYYFNFCNTKISVNDFCLLLRRKRRFLLLTDSINHKLGNTTREYSQ